MKLQTYLKAARMPVGFKSRTNAMASAKKELLAAGFELRHGCGDGTSGWGRYWYTSSKPEALRIGNKPNMTALEVVIEAKHRGLLE